MEFLACGGDHLNVHLRLRHLRHPSDRFPNLFCCLIKASYLIHDGWLLTFQNPPVPRPLRRHGVLHFAVSLSLVGRSAEKLVRMLCTVRPSSPLPWQLTG